MERSLRFLLASVTVLVSLSSSSQSQTPPEAKLFAEGTISVPGAFAVTFTPDGKTVYFIKPEGKKESYLLKSECRDGKWSNPEDMGLSGHYVNVDPFLSPDGTQLFFSSIRPLKGVALDRPVLWVMDKKGDRWSDPRPVMENVFSNADTVGVFPSPVSSGTLYFAGHLPSPAPLGHDDIYFAKRTAKGYAAPENLGPPVNSEHQEYDAFVAPDESFLIFASDRPGGFGASDLYISLRKNGEWTAPRNLGPSVNNENGLCCPAVSPDRKHFYFTTTRNGKQGIFEIDFPALLRSLGIELPSNPASAAAKSRP